MQPSRLTTTQGTSSEIRLGRWISASVVAAVVPLPFLLVLVLSLLLGRPVLASLAHVPGGTDRQLAKRLAVVWATGLAIATVGEAAGAALGVMNIFKLSGLALHSLFGLVVVAVLVVVTVRTLARP